MTFAIILLSITCLSLGILYWQDRLDLRKSEKKAWELCKKNEELQKEFEKDLSGDVPLTEEGIIRYLREERGCEVETDPENHRLLFDMNGRSFLIEADRLPEMTIIKLGFDLSSYGKINWEKVKNEVQKINDSFVMVKGYASEEYKYYHFLIATPDKTLRHFKHSLDLYIYLLQDANRDFNTAMSEPDKNDEPAGSESIYGNNGWKRCEKDAAE